MRSVLALSAFVLLASAQAVLADPTANTVMKVTPPGEAKPEGVDPVVFCTHKIQLQVAQLATLQAQLKLTEAQKPVFDSWKKTRVELLRAVPCPALPTGLDVPAPQRVENQVTTMTASLEGLKKELPATQALYKVLTPEQKAVFDGPMHMQAPPVPGAGKSGN